MKTVVITGANSGIGFAAARYLAALPQWHVVLACRNAVKANASIAEIRKMRPDARVSFASLDLFSFESVRQFPGLLAEMPIPPLSGLILNAGGPNLSANPQFSEDGFEQTLQLNFLGHFLLANLLISHLSTGARIVFVSSDIHDPAATKMGKIMPPKFGPVEEVARSIGMAAKLKPMERYGTAKMFAMMAAYELDRRLKAAGKQITVNSWSPGVVPTTQAGKGMNPIAKWMVSRRWFVNFMGSHLSTEQEAGHALGDLLVSDRYSGVSGKYFDGFKEIPSSVESRDETKARTVWEESARLVELPQGLAIAAG
ncbi:MAG TPA: SDR family NAD(P)-dependent oxidoreductase [Candidatus Sulfotelmatobacter sp.]|nr:SDR family NAD(P)-dependent oxidoreductase [Candidatus Sulfotelmatobacter sp.]